MDAPKNAKITSTFLGREDHGIFTFYLTLDYGNSGQSAGGYALDTYDKPREARVGTAYGLDSICRILETFKVSSWEDLPGTHCRVIATNNGVQALGHIIEDKWYDFEQHARSWQNREDTE